MMMNHFSRLLFVSVLCMNSFSGVQGRKWKGEGTTQNLESIVIGRCYDYIRIVNPAVGEKNCSQIWEAFKNAFINKDPCSILPGDYELFINLTFHTIPPNKSLFWENNRLLVNSFADRGRRYMSLADTLFGFIGDFLNWCGQADSPGLDYESCPTTMECENNAVESFWRMASIIYARRSSGVIHVLLNGSADGGAYPQPGLGHLGQKGKPAVAATGLWSATAVPDLTRESNSCFFADYEIPNLQKDKISQIVIWVVDDIEGPDIESCGAHSVKTLQTRLTTLGYDVTCTDNDKSVMFLLCLDNPDHSKCAIASPDLLSLIIAAERCNSSFPASGRGCSASCNTEKEVDITFCNMCRAFGICSQRKSAPAAQRGPISSDRGGSWNKLMFVSFAGFLFRFALVY